MHQIVLASFNQGKLKEFAGIFDKFNIEILPLSAFTDQVPEETGQTFIENAILKARFATQVTGLPALADDSGLSVKALGGAPGVYSARYAGIGASDEDNIEKLLRALNETHGNDRRAAFICTLAYLRHADDPLPILAEGVWPGEIADQRSGDAGFGYDPIFFEPTLGKTAAELDVVIKNQYSHRARALQVFLSKAKDAGLFL